MKVLVSLIFCFVNLLAVGQYNSGNLDFSLGTGIGIYSATSNESNEIISDKETYSPLLNLRIHYSKDENLGFGINLEKSSFLNSNDSTILNRNASIVNYRLTCLYRIVNHDKLSFAFYAALGFSRFKTESTSANYSIVASSPNLGGGLDWNIFLTPQFGTYLHAGFYTSPYKKLRDQDGELFLTTDHSENQDLTLVGMHLNVGLFYKL